MPGPGRGAEGSVERRGRWARRGTRIVGSAAIVAVVIVVAFALSVIGGPTSKAGSGVGATSPDPVCDDPSAGPDRRHRREADRLFDGSLEHVLQQVQRVLGVGDQ